MREQRGDIWTQLGIASALCITTNGIVKDDGSLVMGKGLAYEAKMRYPGLQATWGTSVKKFGNVPAIGTVDRGTCIVSLPTKDDYRYPSDMKLILRSIEGLKALAAKEGWTTIAMTKPGCGNGGLKWENVKKVIEPLLDDRFTIWM